jgi:hypothetical protein
MCRLFLQLLTLAWKRKAPSWVDSFLVPWDNNTGTGQDRTTKARGVSVIKLYYFLCRHERNPDRT